jgi:hypothetical protein
VQQRGEERSVSGVELDPLGVQLALEDGGLVAEGEDFGILGSLMGSSRTIAGASVATPSRPVEAARPGILAYWPFSVTTSLGNGDDLQILSS